MGMRGRSSGGRPYDYDRGFNQGKTYWTIDSNTGVVYCLILNSMICFFQVAGVDMEMALTIAMEEMAVVVVVVSWGSFAVAQVFSRFKIG